MQVSENWIEVSADSGAMSVLIVAPAGGGTYPGVVHCHSFVGITAHRLNVARRLAQEGFVVALPDLFHRLGKRKSFPMPAGENDAVAAAGSLAFFDMAVDTRLALNALATHPAARRSSLGVLGYGMGGTVAFIAACAHRDVKAAAIAYSRNIVVSAATTARPISPLFLLERLNCPMQFISASGDPVPSPVDVAAIAAMATKYGKVFEPHIYESNPPVGHAFMEEDIPGCHHAAASDWAWRLQVDFLRRRLDGGA